MGTPTCSLASLKISIAGGGAAFTWLQAVSIHRQTHGATWLTPLKPGSFENFMQTFAFSLLLDQARARYDQR